MRNEIVSVIVPVYNVAPYLERCARSLLCQTYAKLEIILVDDGSTDGSAEICDALAISDARVKAFHKMNGGVGSARNLGLDICRGDYVTFADPDDWLEPQAYETMLAALRKSGAQAVFCGYCVRVEDPLTGFDVERIPARAGSVSGTEALYQCLRHVRYGYFTAVWNKIFLRSAILDEDGAPHRFNETYSIAEDEVWLTEVLPKLHAVELVPAPLYNWFQRSGSAVHGTTVSPRWRSALRAKKECIRLVRELKGDGHDLAELTQAKFTAICSIRFGGRMLRAIAQAKNFLLRSLCRIKNRFTAALNIRF